MPVKIRRGSYVTDFKKLRWLIHQNVIFSPAMCFGNVTKT